MLTCLLILTITLFLLTLYSILQTNAEVFHIKNSRFLSIKILDTASSASLFVTLLGALLVRHQFAVSVLPRINYISLRVKGHIKQKLDASCEIWHVEICNTGLGSAIINRTQYIFEQADAKDKIVCNTIEHLLKELAKLNLVPERDYWIANISSGYSLSPKDNFPVFEIKAEHIGKLKRLDMVLYFQGQLGDRYRREISLTRAL